MLDGVFTVGITGTKGKSSTTEFIAQLLESQNLLTAVITTVSSRVGSRYLEPCDDFGAIHDVVRRSRRASTDALVVEMSSDALKGGLNHGFDCAVAVLTNIGTDHVPAHGNLRNYIAAKQRLFKDLAVWRRTPSPAAVLNADDEYAESFARTLQPGVRLITFGMSRRRLEGFRTERHLWATDITHTSTGTRFEVHGLDARPVRLRTALFGEFNVRNVLAALAACRARGPLRDVRRAVLALRPPAGRFDVVQMPSRATPGVIVDYAHTPESVEEALAAARHLVLPGGRVHAVFGCGGHTWRRKRPMMGAAAVRGADRVTLTNDNARTESQERIATDILRGVPRAERHRVDVVLDRRQAIHAAVALAAPGDVVALLGRGHERTLSIGGRTQAVSDPREARRALDARLDSGESPLLPRMSATAAVVIDAASGTVITGLHAVSARFPASLVKLMTLVVALDAIDAGRASFRAPVRVSDYAAQTPHPRLTCRAGTEVPLGALLEALVVRSSNLAATAIAEHVSGSERAFVDAMNETGRRLGLRGSSFATPHGLPHRHQYTTARDMAVLLAHALRRHPRAVRLLACSRITVLGRTYQRRVPLLAPESGVVAVKTGFTWEAGYNVAAAWRAGRTWRVGVVLDAVSRAASFTDMRRLIDATAPGRG